ncbi:MAG: hypothetical protein AB1489_31475 [Acidobacteriota bacterium]
MATITNARLAIQLNLPGKQAKVDVNCEVRFTRLEMFLMQNGLRYKLDCKVWGEDLGWWLNPDDFLFSYASSFFPDASPTDVERVAFTRNVPMSTLNEDIGTDEIYAELILKNMESGATTKKRTNVVKHGF